MRATFWFVALLAMLSGCATGRWSATTSHTTATTTSTSTSTRPHVDGRSNVGATGGGPASACGPESTWGDVPNCGFDNPP